MLGGTRRGEHLGACQLGERDRGLADTAGRGVDQDFVAGLDLRQRVQGIVSSDVRGRQAGGLGEADVSGLAYRHDGGHGDPFAQAARVAEHYILADAELGVRPGRDHGARTFEAQRQRMIRGAAVFSVPLQHAESIEHVLEVEPRGVHAYLDLRAPWSIVGHHDGPDVGELARVRDR